MCKLFCAPEIILSWLLATLWGTQKTLLFFFSHLPGGAGSTLTAYPEREYLREKPLAPDSVSFLQEATMALAEQSPQDLQGHSRGGGGSPSPRTGGNIRRRPGAWPRLRSPGEEAGERSKRLAEKETSHDQDGRWAALFLWGPGHELQLGLTSSEVWNCVRGWLEGVDQGRRINQGAQKSPQLWDGC